MELEDMVSIPELETCKLENEALKAKLENYKRDNDYLRKQNESLVDNYRKVVKICDDLLDQKEKHETQKMCLETVKKVEDIILRDASEPLAKIAYHVGKCISDMSKPLAEIAYLVGQHTSDD